MEVRSQGGEAGLTAVLLSVTLEPPSSDTENNFCSN